MADRYLLESGTPDGYLLENGSGVLLLEPFELNHLYTGQNGLTFDFSDKTTLFKDTAATIPVTATGDLIAAAKDKYGNGITATQATEVLRPIYTEPYNAAPYADFSGDRHLKTGTFATKVQPNFFAAAVKFDTFGTTEDWVIADGGSVNQNLLWGQNVSSVPTLRMFTGTTANVGTLTTDPVVVSGVYNGASSSGRVGNTTSAAVTAGTNSLTGITIGATASGIKGLDGRIYAFVWASIDPTTEQRDNTHNWLAAKLTPPAYRPNMLYSGQNGMTIEWGDKATLFTDAGITPVSAPGDLIYRAYDKYGNGLYADQTNSTLRPVYQEDSGKGYADFNGGKFMQVAAFTAIPQPHFFGQASKFDVLGAGDQILSDSAVNGSRCCFFYDGEFGTMRLFSGGPLVADWGVSATTANDTYSAIFNGASSSIRRGATLGTTNDAGSQGVSGLTFGVAFNGTSGPLDGRLYASVWAAINPTTTQRDDLHVWMNSKLPSARRPFGRAFLI